MTDEERIDEVRDKRREKDYETSKQDEKCQNLYHIYLQVGPLWFILCNLRTVPTVLRGILCPGGFTFFTF